MVLLVGGHMRSGTTLLRDLCNRHPEMTVTNEFNYLSSLGKTYMEHSRGLLNNLWKNTTKKRIKKINFEEHVSNHLFVARYLFYMRTYRKGLIDIAAIESSLRRIFPEVRIFGDKTPDYVFLLDKFAATSGLSCLIIFRDCRDVTSSMLDMARRNWSEKARRNPLKMAKWVAGRWVRGIEIMERHKDRIYIIRYEDLVQEPRRELDALGKWLGVDPAGFPKEMIQDSSTGKYKTGLTEEELKAVMDIAGPTMARLGYIEP